MRIQHTAHLVIGLRHLGTPFPAVVSAGIYSASAANLTHNPSSGDFHADVLHVSADSYAEACTRLREIINEMDQFSWARPWIDESEDAHMARYHWLHRPQIKSR